MPHKTPDAAAMSNALALLGLCVVASGIIAIAADVDDRLFVEMFVGMLVIVFAMAFFAPHVMRLPSWDDEENFADIYRYEGAFGNLQSAPIAEGGRQLNKNEFMAAFKASMTMLFLYFAEECSGQTHKFVMDHGVKHYRYNHATCKIEAFSLGEFHLFPSFRACRLVHCIRRGEAR